MRHALFLVLLLFSASGFFTACSSSDDGGIQLNPDPTDDDDDNNDDSSGTAQMGELCQTNQDCAEGWCITQEMVEEVQTPFCSIGCDVNQADACPEGYCCLEILNAAACVTESICEARMPRTNHQCLPGGAFDTYGIVCGEGFGDCDTICGNNGYEHSCPPTGECRTLAQDVDGDESDGDQTDGDTDGDSGDDDDDDDDSDGDLIDHQCEENGAFDVSAPPCSSAAQCDSICAGTTAGVRFCLGGSCRAAEGNDFTHYCLPDSSQSLMGPPCTGDEDCSEICAEAGAPNGTSHFCFHYSCYAEVVDEDGDITDGDVADGDDDPNPVSRDWPCRDDRDCQRAQYCNPDTGLCAVRTNYCQPCQRDEECINATARCVAGSEGRFCATACLYPFDCPDGFSCTDVAALGARLCMPGSTYLSSHCCADEQCNANQVCDPLSRSCQAVCPATACPAGQQCFEQRCYSACQEHGDCYPWEACLSGACIEADCHNTDDCPLNYRCNDRFTCIPSCRNDDDCVPWMTCNNGQCAERAHCVGSEQCPPGEVCSVAAGSSSSGNCSEPSSGQCDTCSPSSSNPCGGDSNLTCSDVLEDNYYCLHRQDCLNDEECPQGFSCEQAPADGSPLLSGMVCTGRCDRYLDQMLCRVGELRCSGNRVEVCNNTLTGWSLQQDCASTSLVCTPQPEPHCVADQVCQPGDVVCEGTTVLTCSATGAGYDEQECGLRTYCTLPNGDCRCQVGSYRCNENRVEQCNANGTGWSITNQCDAASQCMCTQDDGLYCQSAQCQGSNACNPGDHRCVGDDYVEVCGPNGDQWYLVEICQNGCSSGSCL